MISKSTENDKLFDEFLCCLDEQRFYDAHEALEEIWFKQRFEDDDEVRLIKGFINAAVSFELVKKDKLTQAKNVWKNYLKYRQLLYKINSNYIQKYHYIARYIEHTYLKLHFT